MAKEEQTNTAPAQDSGATIEALFAEDRTFPPPAEFVAKANLQDPGIYERAAADPEAYWASQADTLHWYKPYEKVLTFGGWPYPGQRVIVLSSGLAANDDRITVTRSVEETVALLDERGARGVYVDGGATIQAFLRAGLIDTIVLTRVPVLISMPSRKSLPRARRASVGWTPRRISSPASTIMSR